MCRGGALMDRRGTPLFHTSSTALMTSRMVVCHDDKSSPRALSLSVFPQVLLSPLANNMTRESCLNGDLQPHT